MGPVGTSGGRVESWTLGRRDPVGVPDPAVMDGGGVLLATRGSAAFGVTREGSAVEALDPPAVGFACSMV